MPTWSVINAGDLTSGWVFWREHPAGVTFDVNLISLHFWIGFKLDPPPRSVTIILKTGDHAHTHTRASHWGRSLTEPLGVRRFILGHRSAATDALSPLWESSFTVWRQQSAKRQQQVRKYVSARVKARVSSRGKRERWSPLWNVPRRSCGSALCSGGRSCSSSSTEVTSLDQFVLQTNLKFYMTNIFLKKSYFYSHPSVFLSLNKCSQVFT